MEKIIKNFTVKTKAVDTEAGIYEALITTESVDRMGDVVRADGARIENYLKNPVVMWAHEYSEPPVAKTISLEIIPQTGIRATFQFPEWATYDKADVIRRLWAGGYLNATSIGFMPVKSSNLVEGDQDPWGPKDYQEWELLEFSIVPVPANADALRMAIKELSVDDLSLFNGEFTPARSAPLMGASERDQRPSANADGDINILPTTTAESHPNATDTPEGESSLNDESEAELAEELKKLYQIVVSALTPKGNKK